MTSEDRRQQWTRLATDQVLRDGLIGLSLRSLAEALGTSDRMLIYHFGSKDDLVAEVLRTSNDRVVAAVERLAPSQDLRAAVLDLWRLDHSPEHQPCTRLYVEAAALGLFGREPYASVVRDANARWEQALVGHLVRSGIPRRTAPRAVRLIDAAFLGYHLNAPLSGFPSPRSQSVRDLADAVAALGTTPGASLPPT